MIARIFLAGCFSILLGCATPAVVATQVIQKGDLANNENRYDEAIVNYTEYLRLSPQLGMYRNPSMEASVHRKLAHAYSTQGKYKETLSHLGKALAIDSTIATNKLEVIEDYRNLGIANAYAGDFQEALRFLNTSLRLNAGMGESLKDVKRVSLADTYLSLAQVNLTLGNYKDAEHYGVNGLALYQKIQGEYIGIIESTLLLGIISREKGNLKQASRLLLQSKELAEQHELTTTRQNQALGEVSFLQGDPEDGIRFKLAAVTQAEKSHIKPQIVIAYMRLGDAFQQLGDNVKANGYYQKALMIQQEMKSDSSGSMSPSLDLRLGDVQKAYDYYMQSGSSIGGALVCLRLGEIQYSKKHLDSAKLFYQQAKGLFEKSGSVEGINKSNFELARTHLQAGEYPQAKALFTKTFEATIQPDLQWQIRYHLGILYENTGKDDSAYWSYKEAIRRIDELRGNLTIEEFKTLFANTKVNVYDHMIAHVLRKQGGTGPGVTEAFGYNEQSRSRAFLDMLGNNKMEAKSPGDSAQLENELLLKLKMQQLTKELNKVDRNSAARRQLSDNLLKTQAQYDELLQHIKLNNEAYASFVNIDPPPLAEIQATLDNQTAMVEYWLGENALYIWVITRTTVSSTTVATPRKDLQREISYCRRTISVRANDEMNASIARLSKYLVDPVQASLKGFKNLIIVPHRDLHFLPIQVLEVSPGKRLAEQFVVSYAPSAAIYYYCDRRKKVSGDQFLGLALGDVPIGSLPGLPGTELELKQLAKIYPGMLWKGGTDFSETYLKKNAAGKSVIHLATHGVFNKEQPLYSYLVMSPGANDDGRLTVGEIFGMNIQSRLITLSACETGLGDIGEGDDLVGLSRAFIYAGSGGVIVSLWKIDDTVTALIMTLFYQYLQTNHSAGEALALAQRDVIQGRQARSGKSKLRSVEMESELSVAIGQFKDEALANPFYWAPFVLIGNGR